MHVFHFQAAPPVHEVGGRGLTAAAPPAPALLAAAARRLQLPAAARRRRRAVRGRVGLLHAAPLRAALHPVRARRRHRGRRSASRHPAALQVFLLALNLDCERSDRINVGMGLVSNLTGQNWQNSWCNIQRNQYAH